MIFSTLYISKTVLSSLLCSVSFVTNRTPICVRVFSPSGPPTLSYLSVHLSWNQYYTALIMRALYYILTVKKTFAPPCSHISRVSWPILCLLISIQNLESACQLTLKCPIGILIGIKFIFTNQFNINKTGTFSILSILIKWTL